MKTRKILRDCGVCGDGVQHAMRGVARLHNLNLAGQANRPPRGRCHELPMNETAHAGPEVTSSSLMPLNRSSENGTWER